MFFLFKMAFAAQLGVIEFEESIDGVQIVIPVDDVVQEEALSQSTYGKSCLFRFKTHQFIDESIAQYDSLLLRFIQSKNTPEGSELLLALQSPQKCTYSIKGEEIHIFIGKEPIEIANPISKDFMIALDAGHGGWDAGAVGVSGVREADIVLELTLRLAKELELHDGIRVMLTRSDNTFVELKQRAELVNLAKADLFVSIHANAAPTPDLWGIETYSMNTASDEGARRVAQRENALSKIDDGKIDSLRGSLASQGTLVLSEQLSQSIQKVVIEQLREEYGEEQIRDLGAKTALFYVLVRTQMPAILFEASFLSNREDERRLRAPHFQEAMVKALAHAIITFVESSR